MYKSIINCDKREPVFCENYKPQEIVNVEQLNKPSFNRGIEYISNQNMVEAKVIKSGCGVVAINNSTGCVDGRQTKKVGPNMGLTCNDGRCRATIFPNAAIPIDKAPLQSRHNNTSPDGLPVYNTTLNYNNYSDINVGDWVYYVDKDMATPYHLPNFTISGYTEKQYFTDPMGNTSLEFPTERVTETGRDISEYPDLRNELIHRENQMASIVENISNKDEYTKAYYS